MLRAIKSLGDVKLSTLNRFEIDLADHNMSRPGKWRRRIGNYKKYTSTDSEIVNLFPSSKAVDLFHTLKSHSSSVRTRPMATTYTAIESRLRQSVLHTESVTVDGLNSGTQRLENNKTLDLEVESVTVDGLNSVKWRVNGNKRLREENLESLDGATLSSYQ